MNDATLVKEHVPACPFLTLKSNWIGISWNGIYYLTRDMNNEHTVSFALFYYVFWLKKSKDFWLKTISCTISDLFPLTDYTDFHTDFHTDLNFDIVFLLIFDMMCKMFFKSWRLKIQSISLKYFKNGNLCRFFFSIKIWPMKTTLSIENFSVILLWSTLELEEQILSAIKKFSNSISKFIS